MVTGILGGGETISSHTTAMKKENNQHIGNPSHVDSCLIFLMISLFIFAGRTFLAMHPKRLLRYLYNQESRPKIQRLERNFAFPRFQKHHLEDLIAAANSDLAGVSLISLRALLCKGVVTLKLERCSFVESIKQSEVTYLLSINDVLFQRYLMKALEVMMHEDLSK